MLNFDFSYPKLPIFFKECIQQTSILIIVSDLLYLS